MDKKQVDKSINLCPPTCSVCGSKASGYHYDVPSCNGCKTFFRRAIILENDFRCTHKNNCYGIKDRNSACKCCRFRRCLEVGMNPLCIQTSTLVFQKKLVEQFEKLKKIKLETENEKLFKKIVYLIHLEDKLDDFRKCSYNPNSFEVSLDELIKSSSKLSLADTPMPEWPVKKDMMNHLGGPHLEAILKKGKTNNIKYWLIFDIITTVEYTKTFPFFHELNDTDKTILIRGVVLLCYNITQIFYSYASNSDCVKFPDGTYALLPAQNSPYQFVCYKRNNAISILNREKLTRSEYVLLKQLMICNASLTGLSERGVKIVKKQKEEAFRNLLSFCFSQYGSSGPSRYAMIISLFDYYEQTSNAQKDLFLLQMIQNQGNHSNMKLIHQIILGYS